MRSRWSIIRVAATATFILAACGTPTAPASSPTPSLAASAVVSTPTAASSAGAGAGCPTLPISLETLIELDRDVGDLTQRFGQSWPYPERARACFDGEEITFVGFVANPDGLGGLETYSLTPKWLAYSAFFVQPTQEIIDRPAFGAGPFFRVTFDPALGDPMLAFNANWVRVTGHFVDPAAATCRATGQAGATPTQEEAIAICETMFVATAIVPVDAP
jgi:hypothetical protein